MAIDDIGLHQSFKLNGIPYTKPDLKALAYDLVKEGSDFEKSIGNFLSDWLDEKSTIEVQTSGSTGTPKNILLKKQHMVNSALATGEYFDLKKGNTAFLCLPTDYIAGKMMLVRAMILGLELDYVEPTSSPLSGLSKDYDFAAMVPLQLENSLKEIEMIKTLIVGGTVVSRSLKEKVQEKNTAVFETYGMTETITHVAVTRINGVVEYFDSAQHKLRRIHFNAIPNVAFSIDKRDCLVISAPKVSNNPVITNDIVNLISETKFEWLGRYDTIINSGGIKLFPEQIEEKLSSLLSNRFFVAGIPDEKLGQKLVLIVEGEIDSNELIRILDEFVALERFEVPKNIYALPEFVTTDTGKIRRKENLLLIKK